MVGRWGWLILAAFILLRLSFWWFTFPNPDEAYYWLWGQHPGFSYYDHPPFHAWVQGIMTAGLGRSQLVLRLPNLISSIILGLTYNQILRYLYHDHLTDRFQVLLLLLASSPLFFLFLALAWNDHWLVTFSLLSGFWFVRFLDSYLADGRGHSPDLYGAALTLGLAGLCKYNALFVGLGFLVTLLGQRRLYPLWRDYRLYLGIMMIAITLSPILLWNGQHHFYSFQFYVERNSSGAGLSIHPLQPLVFLLLCSLILGPIHSWSLGYSLGRPQPLASSTYRTVALAVFGCSTAAFTLLSLVSVAIYYWNILAYPLLFPLLVGVFLPPRPPSSDPQAPLLHHARPFWTAQGLGLGAMAILIFHYTVIPLTAFLGNPVDPDSAALYGWPAVATAVTRQAQSLPHPLLLTTDYRSAAALAYQLDDPTVMAISGRIDQFDFWYDAAAMAGRDAVLLGETWHPLCPAHLAMFNHTEPPEIMTVSRFGVTLQTYQLVRAYGFRAGDSDTYPLQPNYPLAFSSDGERCQP